MLAFRARSERKGCNAMEWIAYLGPAEWDWWSLSTESAAPSEFSLEWTTRDARSQEASNTRTPPSPPRTPAGALPHPSRQG